MEPQASNFQGILYYLKTAPAVGERDAEKQLVIFSTVEVVKNWTPTREEVYYYAPPGAENAIFAYMTWN